MTLRTVHLKNGQATVRAGATLLYDSDPMAEERETHIKASAFLGATLDSKRLVLEKLADLEDKVTAILDRLPPKER